MSGGLPPLPLTGGPRSDRPLILYTQELVPYQDRFRAAPDGRLVPALPEWLTGFVRVRGPFVDSGNLAARAFRLGWPVRVRGQQVELAGRILPELPGGRLGSTTLVARLAVASAWLGLTPAARSRVGPAWEPGGLPLLLPSEAPWATVTQRLSLSGAQPGALYVLVTRIPSQDAERAAAGRSDLMVSEPHAADPGGAVEFPLSNHLPARGLQYRQARLRLEGDLDSWAGRVVSSSEFSALVLQVPGTFQRARSPIAFAPPEALNRLFPLE